MTQRTITSHVLNLHGAARVGDPVRFRLLGGMYTATEHVPADVQTATIDASGNISIALYSPANYDCIIANAMRFQFTLPDDPVTPTTLEALHATSGDLPDTATNDLQTVLDSAALRGNNLSDLTDTALARTNLGVPSLVQLTALQTVLTSIDALPGAMRLSVAPLASATSITLRTAPTAIGANLGWLIIDPFTVECEVRKITGLAGAVATVAALTYAHAVDDAVLWVAEPDIHVALFGAKGDANTASAATNVTAIQRAIRTAYEQQFFRVNLGIGFYYVNATIYLDQEVLVEGYSSDYTALKAAPGFSFPDANTAILRGRRDSDVALYDSISSPAQKVALRNFQIDGSAIAGSNGLLVSCEQPSYIENVRFANCKGYGLTLPDTQQCHLMNPVFKFNGVGLRLRSALFIHVHGINVEFSDTAHVIVEKITGGQDCAANHFIGVHLEAADAGTATCFDISASRNILLENVYVSAGIGTPTVFKFSGMSAAEERAAGYTIINTRVTSGNNNTIMLDDSDRGLSLNANSVFRNEIEHVVGGHQNDAIGPNSLCLFGLNGRYLKFGTPHAGTLPSIDMQAATSGGGPFAVFRNSAGSNIASIEEDGEVQAAKLVVDGLSTHTGKAIFSGHVKGGGNAPTPTAFSGAGTGPTVSVQGSDVAGTIQVTTGTTPNANSAVVQVVFATPYASTPHVILTPLNANAAALYGPKQVRLDAEAPTGFYVWAGLTALDATLGYTWRYVVVE